MTRTPELVNSPLDKVYITQFFGNDFIVPKTGKWAYKSMGMLGHNGVDFRVRFADTPLGRRYIYPIFDGKVIRAGWDNGYGWYVRLQHRGNSQTVYGHGHRKPYVKAGDEVTTKDKILLSGSTGFSTAPHLHLGLRPDNYDYNNGYFGYVDPMPYLLGQKSLDPNIVDPAMLINMEFAKKWAGWIIIVPELGGEVWHVHPTTYHRTFLGKNITSDVAQVLAAVQKTKEGEETRGWWGFRKEDLDKIPVADPIV